MNRIVKICGICGIIGIALLLYAVHAKFVSPRSSADNTPITASVSTTATTTTARSTAPSTARTTTTSRATTATTAAPTSTAVVMQTTASSIPITAPPTSATTTAPQQTTVPTTAQTTAATVKTTSTQTVVTTTAPTTTTAPPVYIVTNEQLSQIKAEFFRLVNEERQRIGVDILTSNAHLDACAEIRSGELQSCWSHTRPDGTMFHTVVDDDQYYYASIGENICMNGHFSNGIYDTSNLWTGTPDQIRSAAELTFKLFKDSSGHYNNMTNTKYEDTGIGVSYTWYDTGVPLFYTVQLFGAEVK